MFFVVCTSRTSFERCVVFRMDAFSPKTEVQVQLKFIVTYWQTHLSNFQLQCTMHAAEHWTHNPVAPIRCWVCNKSVGNLRSLLPWNRSEHYNICGDCYKVSPRAISTSADELNCASPRNISRITSSFAASTTGWAVRFRQAHRIVPDRRR